MILSDVSVRRPVFATVLSLILIAFGLLSFSRLPLREYPDINPPIVSVETRYPGASAQVVETKITQLIEDSIAGIEGIRTISSASRDGTSNVTIEFEVERDIDAAANDVRDRVSRTFENLPEEADPPEIAKADANTQQIMWLSLASDRMDQLQLSDYARRFVTDRLAMVTGVANVRIGGEREYSMRIWLDREALAARGLTVADVESALRSENVELPAGTVESREREFTVRVERSYATASDFAGLVLRKGADGYLVRLADVARVEVGPANDRSELRANGSPNVGLGISAQAKANVLDTARAVKAELLRIQETLPEGMEIVAGFDASIYIEQAIVEVYKTLFLATGLVVLVIYLFLGSVRAMLVPAVTVPVSLISAFIVLWAFGFSINLLTLLALVLSIGLVVDDAIVVLENVYRRVEKGEPPLLAAYKGARQVGFAVIATTLVLVAVFVPIAFMEGNLGRLFSEFSLAIAGAVCFSSLVALTLVPMLSSKLLRPDTGRVGLARWVDDAFNYAADYYSRSLDWLLRHTWLVYASLLLVLAGGVLLFRMIPQEYAPTEDRSSFFVLMNAPEGASFEYTQRYSRRMEQVLMPLLENGEAYRILVSTPRFGSGANVNNAIAIVSLETWDKRDRSAQEIIGQLFGQLGQLPGVRAFPIQPASLGQRGFSTPLQFVIGGDTYEELAEWRDRILDRASENPQLINLDSDYKEVKPQLIIEVDRNRAADLGVPIVTIGRTLETMLGSRRVTTYLERGEEYDVILQADDRDRETPEDISNLYVRSDRTGELVPLSSLVTVREKADAADLNRFNRLRAVTISANLAPDYPLGEALAYMQQLAAEELPSSARIDYKGQSRELQDSSASVLVTFGLALLVVFLVLAAQFESFIHPLIIMVTVPLAVAGALLGLFLVDGTLNIYSQIGIVMMVGLAAKNGILIVEFANQLRDAGRDIETAIREAARLRLRPIVMTSISTVIGVLPLILGSGAGAESRMAIGVVVFSGVLLSTVLTLGVVPTFYELLARFTRSPEAVSHEIEALFEAEAKAESGTPRPAAGGGSLEGSPARAERD
ncbi:MAG: efflux RND transporter permease subunit [Pseudomonadales bacterium]|jgi:multidrug efflux pump|nr:efflux RND transporter permease subunit [Pseudomonadales bacterium]